MENIKDNTKIVFSKNIAIKLREMGFNIIKTKPNLKYPQYDTYVFNDTPEFRSAFDSIMEKYNRKNLVDNC